MKNSQQRYLEFGGFRLDTAERALLRDGKRISLTHKSYHLLLTLIENKGHLLTHDELMRSVWQETSVDQSSLKQNIALIRKALGDGKDEPQFIQTVPKYGYRFIAPVNFPADENIALVATRQTLTQIDIEEELAEITPAKKKFFTRFKILSFVLLALILTSIPAGIFIWRNFSKNAASPTFAVENIVPRKLTDSGTIEHGALSPNGEFIVFSTQNGEKEMILWLRQVDARETLKLVSQSLPFRIAAFTVTNDGKWIYYVTTKNGEWNRQAQLFRVSIIGGKSQKITEYLDGFVSFSPDDSRMVFNRFTSEGCELITANAADGSGEKIIARNRSTTEFLDPKWSPDGKRILFFNIERRADGNFSSLSTIEIESGEIRQIIAPRRQRIWFLAWTQSGEIVINATDPATRLPQIYTVSEKDGELRRVTNDLFYYSGVSVGGNSILATKKERPSDIWISDAENFVNPSQKIIGGAFFDALEWTPDGTKIVFDAADGGKRHLWTMNADASEKEQISPDTSDDLLPDISPDGKRLAFISNRSGTYEIWTSEIDGSRPRQLTSGNPRVWRPRFAADGNSVYFEMTNESETFLTSVSTQGGTVRRVFPDAAIENFDISPDGKFAAYSFADKETNKVRVALRSLETGEIVKIFDLAPARFLRFTRDGTALIFKNSDMQTAPASSVWIQPLAESAPRQLADFREDDVIWADFSPDGKRFATVRGKLTSDLILLTSAKKSNSE